MDNPFQYFRDLGFTTLLPVIPPGAPVSETSFLNGRIAAGQDPRGKVPGVKNGNGKWHSMKDWPKYEATPDDLPKWNAMGAGVGIRTGGGLIAIDSDTLNPDYALIVRDTINKHIGRLPVRVGNAPKAAFICRVDVSEKPFAYTLVEFGAGDKKERVEILSDGRFFVAEGIHQKTNRPYTWPRGYAAFDDIPVVKQETIHAILEDLRQQLPAATVAKTSGASDVDQESLGGGLESVRQAVAAIPNTSVLFPKREDYLNVGYAIKAALPDYPEDAFEIFAEWCERWDGGENKLADADWTRMVPPYRRGASWLYDLAAQHGDGSFSPASLWFDVIEETASPFDVQHTATAATETAQARRRLEWMDFADVVEADDLGENPYLIKGLLDQGAMSVLYGDSNVGKSFVAMDIAFHIAAGLPYCGMKTAPGPALYIAAEGGRGAKKRLKALKDKFPKHADTRQFKLLPEPVDLLRPDADTVPLIESVRAMGVAPALLIVDTVSRALSGGDENSSVDMGALVKHLDRIRAALPPVHLMVIHHTGKDKAKGARGHSLLRAATDTEIEVDEGVVSVTKQRDLDKSWTTGFALDVHTLGVDSDGDPVRSCTIKTISRDAQEAAKVKATAGEQAVLDGLSVLIETSETPEKGIRTADILAHMADKMSGESVKTHIKTLHKKGLISQKQRGFWGDCVSSPQISEKPAFSDGEIWGDAGLGGVFE